MSERCLKLFLSSIKSNATKECYIENLNKFKKFTKINTYSDLTKMDIKQVQILVEDYVLLLGETTHPNSIPTIYYPIQTFLEMNDILINFKKIRRLFPAKVKTAVERGWTVEEIRQMLSVANDTRSRAIIHFENASGGRIGIFNGLIMKHLIEINDDDYGKCYAIIGYSGEREEYITFLTPEATNVLDAYFDKRRSDGEIINKNTPVFREKYIFGAKLPQPMGSSALGEVVRRVVKKAGLRRKKDKKGNRFAIPTNHGFRHRFNEIIKSVDNVNPNLAEKIFAHTVKTIKLDTTYLHSNLKLFSEYKKIIPYIMIDESIRKQYEYDEIKKRNAEIEKTHIPKEQLVDEVAKKVIETLSLIATNEQKHNFSKNI